MYSLVFASFEENVANMKYGSVSLKLGRCCCCFIIIIVVSNVLGSKFGMLKNSDIFMR